MGKNPRDKEQRGAVVDIDAEMNAGDGTGTAFGHVGENDPQSDGSKPVVRTASRMDGFGTKSKNPLKPGK
jgi:hypothetical protein